MRDAACDTGVIIADAVALAELPGGTGHERVRIDWLNKRLAAAPGSRHVDGVGNLVWTFGPPPYRLAVLVHVDDVFGEQTARGVTRRDGWLCGLGIGDNAIAVATTAAVIERALAGREERPLAVVFTVGEEGSAGCAAPDMPAASWRPKRCWRWKVTVRIACSPTPSGRCGCGSR
jgi:acetylornithine deacetylase/succinyl-diaminopimelate desuccinylase-like protein